MSSIATPASGSPDARALVPLVIAGGALTAHVMPYGATLVDLRLEGWPHPLVLGFPDTRAYIDSDHYAGAVVGRHANRLGNGRSGRHGFAVTRNWQGHHLHGGRRGFSRQPWRVDALGPDMVRFALSSPDGQEGYRGQLDATVTYRLERGDVLAIEFEARTDRPTIVNLCHHAYFNLDGAETVDAHTLTVMADTITEIDADLIPTGTILPVAGTPFDLRRPISLGTVAAKVRPGLNHNYCLASAPRPAPARVARLRGSTGLELDVATTQTGLHVYDGYKLLPGAPGHGQRPYGPRAGVCLEAQNWPDAPNHQGFPQPDLAPGEIYRHRTEFRFAAPKGTNA